VEPQVLVVAQLVQLVQRLDALLRRARRVDLQMLPERRRDCDMDAFQVSDTRARKSIHPRG